MVLRDGDSELRVSGVADCTDCTGEVAVTFRFEGNRVGTMFDDIDGTIVKDAKMISDGDIPSVVAGVYLDVSMDIVRLLQSIFGLNVLRKLIPRIKSPVANASITMADIVNLTLVISKVTKTISLMVVVDLSAKVTL